MEESCSSRTAPPHLGEERPCERAAQPWPASALTLRGAPNPAGTFLDGERLESKGQARLVPGLSAFRLGRCPTVFRLADSSVSASDAGDGAGREDGNGASPARAESPRAGPAAAKRRREGPARPPEAQEQRGVKAARRAQEQLPEHERWPNEAPHADCNPAITRRGQAEQGGPSTSRGRWAGDAEDPPQPREGHNDRADRHDGREGRDGRYPAAGRRYRERGGGRDPDEGIAEDAAPRARAGGASSLAESLRRRLRDGRSGGAEAPGDPKGARGSRPMDSDALGDGERPRSDERRGNAHVWQRPERLGDSGRQSSGAGGPGRRVDLERAGNPDRQGDAGSTARHPRPERDRYGPVLDGSQCE